MKAKHNFKDPGEAYSFILRDKKNEIPKKGIQRIMKSVVIEEPSWILGLTKESSIKLPLHEDKWIEFMRRRVNNEEIIINSDIVSITFSQTNLTRGDGNSSNPAEAKSQTKSNLAFIKTFLINYHSVNDFMFQDGSQWVPPELVERLQRRNVSELTQGKNEVTINQSQGKELVPKNQTEEKVRSDEVQLMEDFSDEKKEVENIEIHNNIGFFTFQRKWRKHLEMYNKIFIYQDALVYLKGRQLKE